jgi:hypothetical protein
MRARAAAAIAGAAAAVSVGAVILVSSERADSDHAPEPETPLRPQDCPVTIPNGSTPPGEGASREHHGNGALWTTLGHEGTFLVAPKSAPEYLGPEGEIAVDGILGPDGSVGIKAPWWRGPGVRGQVRLRAQRLDAPAPPVDRTIPPAGYGLTGFQATGLKPADHRLLEGHRQCRKRHPELRHARARRPRETVDRLRPLRPSAAIVMPATAQKASAPKGTQTANSDSGARHTHPWAAPNPGPS